MNKLWAVIGCAVLAACASAEDGSLGQAAPLVNTNAVVPDLVVDMRYHGSNNFIGRRINGYDAPTCLLTKAAATSLAEVQMRLKRFGFGLKVFDCYRPQRAVNDFTAWARDPDDTAQKPAYYPDIDKADLFDLGYIAERSGHSRGSTVDLTLIDLKTGDELDMGAPWDLFDPLSWSDAPALPASARANRLLLRAVMIDGGFAPYDKEWWHFTLAEEPFPDTYFDHPITDEMTP